MEVADRIELTYDASERLSQAIERHADYIRNETLCLALRSEEVLTAEAHKINGEPVRLFLSRAGATRREGRMTERDLQKFKKLLEEKRLSIVQDLGLLEERSMHHHFR